MVLALGAVNLDFPRPSTWPNEDGRCCRLWYLSEGRFFRRRTCICSNLRFPFRTFDKQGYRGDWGVSLASEDAPPIPWKRTCNGKILEPRTSERFRSRFRHDLHFDELPFGQRRTMVIVIPVMLNEAYFMSMPLSSPHYTRQTCRTLISVCIFIYRELYAPADHMALQKTHILWLKMANVQWLRFCFWEFSPNWSWKTTNSEDHSLWSPKNLYALSTKHLSIHSQFNLTVNHCLDHLLLGIWQYHLHRNKSLTQSYCHPTVNILENAVYPSLVEFHPNCYQRGMSLHLTIVFWTVFTLKR